MSAIRDFVAGPWRAVLVLGVTQILAWGTIFYPPVLTVPLIAADRGWSFTLAMAGFSLALLTAGLASPRTGLLIDRFGGHRVMPVGSLLGALGLVGLVYADHPASYLGGLDAARRRDLGLALRSGVRHARPHLRRRRAAADHRADAGRRLCLDGELAGHASADPVGRLARHLSGLCRGAGAGGGAAACVRAAAHPRGGRQPVRRRHGRIDRARCCRRAAGRSCWWRRRLRPMRSCRPDCRRICWRSSAAPASMPPPSSPSARCSARRRCWRASASLRSHGGFIRFVSRGSRVGLAAAGVRAAGAVRRLGRRPRQRSR